MPFSTFSKYDYLLGEEDKKKKPSQVASQEQKFKTFTRLGQEALQFKEPEQPKQVATTPERTPSIWETAKKKVGEVVSTVGQTINKMIPGGAQAGIERVKQAPASSYIIGAGQTPAEQAGRQYLTDTLSMAVNGVQGVGKLTPAYQTYRAVINNPVTPKEYATDLLTTGLDALGLSWRLQPIAPAVGATLNTWVDVRKYFQGKIDAGELINSPARGIANQPGVGEVITDNVNWASAIDVAFMATMFAKPFATKKINQLNLKAQEINNLKSTLGVEPSATMKEVGDAFKAKMRELPDTFTANPNAENMALRKQLTNAFNTLKKTGALEQKYAQAYDFIQSKLGKVERAIQPQPVPVKPKQLPSGEKPITDLNKPLNVKNAEIIKADILSGKKEVARLSNPDQLKIAVSYPANNLPETATPDTLVKVYRAGTDIETKTGDFVTLDKTNAEKYVEQREGSKVMTAQVLLKDLVFSGGLKSEFIYVPKEETKPPTVTTEGQKEAPISTMEEIGKQIEKKAIKEYGTTTVPESAGFITSSGKIIDSSGKKQGSGMEGRNVDHREIAVNSIPDNSETAEMTGSDALSYFMDKTNATRISITTDEINIDTIHNLSDKQLNQLEKLSQGKTIVADISRLDGSVIKSGTFKSFSEYKNWINTNFKETIEKPQGQTQPLSEAKPPQKTVETGGGARVVTPMNETVTKEVPREQLPVGDGKEKVSRLEARIKGVLGKANQGQIETLGLSTFEQMNKKENIRSASEYVIKNPDEALRVLSGEIETPKGLARNSIFVAMERLATENKNVDLSRKLASLRSTRFGQELSILTELDPESPVKAMSDIVKIRIQEFERKHKGESVAKAKKRVVENIKREVKAPNIDEWSAFISSIQC